MCLIDTVAAIGYTRQMKNAFLISILLCILPVLAFSHPGKTNHYGGHNCYKGCEEWGLYYEEYHLHDKDGRPIRVDKKMKVPETAVTVDQETMVTDSVVSGTVPTAMLKTEIVTTYRFVTNVYEENLFLSNPYVYILLMLLLLLLVLRMNRSKENN